MTISSSTTSTTFSNVRFEVLGHTKVSLSIPDLTVTGLSRSVSQRRRTLRSVEHDRRFCGRCEALLTQGTITCGRKYSDAADPWDMMVMCPDCNGLP